MATKNLARTVLEAGRTSVSQHGRRRLRRRERHAARRFCYDAVTYEDLDDLDPAPGRLPKDWDFAQDDCLGPLIRWMDSHVGQSWDVIWSKLTPLRSGGIAASHVVDVHIVGYVAMNKVDRDDPYRWAPYHLDDDRILRRGGNSRFFRSSKSTWRADQRRAAHLREVAGDRKINVVGKRLFWVEPDTFVTWSAYHGRRTESKRSYRQTRELTATERALFDPVPKDLVHATIA